MTAWKEQIRDAGYETLFMLGGFVALSMEPTGRNLERIGWWIDGEQTRRQHLRRLRRRGLIETGEGGDRCVARITEQGSAVFAGGRHPEERWNRGWDGKWRILTFDLPRRENAHRMRLRRWLCAEWFGRLQGSVWIGPDPVKGLEGVLGGEGVDPSMVMVFEGDLAGSQGPREVAALAWDFDAINQAYRRYMEVTARMLDQLGRKAPGRAELREILHAERKPWIEAVRLDPLLPQDLLPEEYEGAAAWRERGKLMRRLGRVLDII